jgi:hypothetical protein
MDGDEELKKILDEQEKLMEVILTRDPEFERPLSAELTNYWITTAVEGREEFLIYKRNVYKDTIRPIARDYVSNYRELHSGKHGKFLINIIINFN